jgi:hypothetical protein
MNQGVGAAGRPLSDCDRKDLAIQALAGSETVSDLAARREMSRKFVYRQTYKARAALDDAFSSATPDEAVLFELAVTKTRLRQVIVALPLVCRSSYRSVIEFLRDLLGLLVSLGHVHDVLQAAARQASAVNAEQDLSGIRVDLHNEIFQGATHVLGIGRAGQRDPDGELVVQLALARPTEAWAAYLARDIRTLVQWLSHDPT